ncbi:hypothetical protein ABZ816_17610 [Actinosynnema sp. NPDC047251]|uniref:Uncharacterized protein n=1 Tax=Saccharothrix espanaensis (strain ATCC 51144 / DSM 44229 / JCM 9112 / NBRC 15066 / NRRL 15764) TaxID=1179773 RepID=K0JW74_SACES|nr:hypothetical protein [Saccharothrix espanaensis]CCH30286.1 hypothetical protein BN6_29790 [Saccharothrix espanaensis DSM 44229]
MSRKLLVWLHVLTSTGWMCMALALFVVVSHALDAAGPACAASFDVALLIDVDVLQFMATTSAFTGLMLSGLTPWGYFRHWWVLAKFVVTFSQLYVGIFVLSPNLHAEGSPALMRLGSLLMAGALAGQVWLSVAKPLKRTPWARPGKVPTAPAWAFAACLVVPAVDYALGEFVLGQSIPALSLVIVMAHPVVRAVARRQSKLIRLP